MTDLVRACPVCDAENAPQQARCACGASLLGVDFSLPRAAFAPQSPQPPVSDPPRADDPLAGLLEPPPAGRTTAPADAASQSTAPRTCAHADCGQPNAAGAVRCVYCNRPLEDGAPGNLAGAAASDTRPLPSALRERYRIRDAFPATGSEADILLVDDTASGTPVVVKLYRKGLRPDFHLLEILAASVGDGVVRVLAHGVSDGVAYEVLEYVPGGTLEAFLQAGPVPASDVRRIVAEIAAALRGIHAHRILHRDLKPENVLLRSRSPLKLALTDFGIASISAATQHFTSGARTTQYAAPEALTGVIDAKSDWWSLGMIALEAATGRHPYAGLTEQVMNHQLATRPVDVRAVADDDLRRLCRGLLLRDPQRRWGDAEVTRWLANDPTLAAPEDSEAPTAVKPYRIAGIDCASAEALGLAMASHWEDARKDLARGQVARWVEVELHDYDLLRQIRDVQDVRGTDDDLRLLRVLRRLCPGLPALWGGRPLDRATIVDAARRATDDDGDAQRWLASIIRNRVLEEFDDEPALAALGAQCREGWVRFVAAWQSGANAHAAEHASAGRTGADGTGPANFDHVVFGTVPAQEPPDEHLVVGPLLLVLNEPAYLDALRNQVLQAHARLPGPAAWFDAIVERAGHDGVAWLAARALLDLARGDADAAARRQAAAASARARAIADAHAALHALVESLLVLAPEDADIDADAARLLTERFDALQEQCAALQSLDLSDPRHDTLRTMVDKLQVQGFAVQRALAKLEQDRGVDAIFLTRERISFAVVAIVIAFITRIPWVIAATIIVLGSFTLYRWYARFHSTDAVLAALRRFRLPARIFVRPPSAEAASVTPPSAPGRLLRGLGRRPRG